MVDMILTDSLWEEWKYKMPYIQDMIWFVLVSLFVVLLK
jgi:hypothetical protein